MYTTLIILIVIVSVLLILVVLIQNSQGGGLASNFSGSSQVMGVKKTNDFIEQATWGLAIAMLVLCVAVTFFRPKAVSTEDQESKIHGQIENVHNSTTAPNVGGGEQQPTVPTGTK